MKVWTDNWIPKNEIFKVISARGGHDQGTLVSYLIDHDLGSWKRNLLNSRFEPWEAHQIACIPISRSGLEDKLVWH